MLGKSLDFTPRADAERVSSDSWGGFQSRGGKLRKGEGQAGVRLRPLSPPFVLRWGERTKAGGPGGPVEARRGQGGLWGRDPGRPR